MPDITMCVNKACPLKEGCYRFTAKPDPYRQSYAMFEPKMVFYDRDGYSEMDLLCDHFIDNNHRTQGRKL
jgi:hypothetical protein